MSIGLQCRVLLVPWMRRSGSILYSNVRASSSFPVRYRPKKTLKTEQPPISSTPTKGRGDEVINKGLRLEVPSGEKISQRSFVLDKKPGNQIQRPIQYLAYNASQEPEEEINYDEGASEYGCIEEPEEVVQELGIRGGGNPPDQHALRAGKTEQDAEKLAIELLASRSYTAVELKKKLQMKRFPVDVINALITDFQSRGLINDCLYAETFSQSRWASSSWGPRRIKQVLLKKGVNEVDAEKAIQLVFQGDSCKDQESRFGLSKTSMDHLLVQASKQWVRGRDVTTETRKARIVRWLQYRGFNWGVISVILKKLEARSPSDS